MVANKRQHNTTYLKSIEIMTNQSNRDNNRRQIYKREELKRKGLKFTITNLSLSATLRLASTQRLQGLSRNGSITRVRNRCVLTGRGRGVYQLTRLSRIAFRELALRGVLPGVSKDSW